MNVVIVSNIKCIEIWARVMAVSLIPSICAAYPNESKRSHELARERANVELCEYCNKYYFN